VPGLRREPQQRSGTKAATGLVSRSASGPTGVNSASACSTAARRDSGYIRLWDSTTGQAAGAPMTNRNVASGAAARRLRLQLDPDQPGRVHPDKAATAEHWYRHRRDHGRLAAPARRPYRRPGHPGRARRARRQGHNRDLAVAADRRRGRLIRQARDLTLRLPPGLNPVPESSSGSGTCLPSPDPRLLTSGSLLIYGLPSRPEQRKASQTGEPGAGSRAVSMPVPGIVTHQDHLL
jgi:hypothetical protein